MKKTSTELGFWERFYQIFSPKFLSKLMANRDMSGKSWGFWFLSNTILAIIPVIIGFFAINYWAPKLPALMESEMTEKTFQIPGEETETNVLEFVKNIELKIEGEDLTVTGVPDPLALGLIEGQEQALVITPENIEAIDFMFVLDTKNELNITEEILRQKRGGIIVNQKTAKIWDSEKGELTDMIFSEITTELDAPIIIDWEIFKNGFIEFLPDAAKIFLIIFGIALWFFFAIARLLNVLFWTLAWWGIGAIFKIKNLTFEKTFETLLHFGFITLILAPVGLFAFGSVFFWNLLVLGCLFGMNFFQIKNEA